MEQLFGILIFLQKDSLYTCNSWSWISKILYMLKAVAGEGVPPQNLSLKFAQIPFLIEESWKGTNSFSMTPNNKAQGRKRNYVLQCIKRIPDRIKREELEKKLAFTQVWCRRPLFNYLITPSCVFSNDCVSREETDCVQLTGAGREFQIAPAGFSSFKTYPAHIKPPTQGQHTHTHTNTHNTPWTRGRREDAVVQSGGFWWNRHHIKNENWTISLNI